MYLDDENRESSAQDLLPLVREYLGTALFKNVYQYQAIANNHIKYLQFNVKSVVHNNQNTSDYKEVFVDDLLLETNYKQILNVHLVRSIQFNNIAICLCSDDLRPISPHSYITLVIVFTNRQLAKNWCQSNLYLTKLLIKNPFKSIHKFQTPFPLVIAHPQSITIKSKRKFFSKQSEAFKKQANIKFKQKKFQEALLIYEMGIGLLVDTDKKRQRAVFYANSSQCLFQMRLFQIALFYAEISISLDRTYIKGLYRKLSCVLQIGAKDSPRIISTLSLMGAPSEAEEAQIKYTRFMANQSGLYNWTQIFESNSPSLGQFISQKLQLKKSSKGRDYLVTDKKISKYELLLVEKALIYKRSQQQKFNEQYLNLTKQIRLYCKIQTSFYERFKNLPHQEMLKGQLLTFEPSNNEKMDFNEIQTICLRCLQVQKSLENNNGSKGQMLGIWQKLFLFQHDCLANCSYLHIKGALVVFALQDIEAQQALTLDFLNWETINRKNLMKQKLGRTCSCVVCYFQWQQYQHIATPEILFQLLISSKNTMPGRDYDKINLYFIWDLISKKRGNQVQLIKHYLTTLESYPQWQFIMNCLKYLRSSHSQNDVSDLMKTTLKRIFEKYFKINHSQAVHLLKIFL